MTLRSMFSTLASLLVGVVGCGTAPTPVPAAPPPATADGSVIPANAEMQFHFWDVAEARDAIIKADLSGVRPPLLRIAEGTYGDDMPVDWRQWIEEMQEEARRGASVQTLEEAAVAVAELSGTCAECHRATRAGPTLADDAPGYHPSGEGLPERMQRHMYAAEALWVGLTAPQHQSWSRGARALSALPLPEQPGEPGEQTGAAPAEDTAAEQQPSQPPAVSASPFAARLDAIRALGTRADEAGQPSEKIAVYGEILTQCAGCHAQVGGPGGG